MASGAICAETLTGTTSDLTLDEYLDFLQPQPERPDPDHPGQNLPARSGALCQSSADWSLTKSDLEQACRALGPRCSYAVKAALARMQGVDDMIKKSKPME